MNSSSGSVTLTALGNNTGTQIQDANPGTRCWYKINYRGDPLEWGAYADGNTDSTTAVEDWLGAYGAAASNSTSNPPSNFGPWIASLPGTYKVNAPLICPPNAVITGQSNLSAENGSPAVEIVAGSSFTVPTGFAPAVMTLSNYCRLTGIAINANNISGIDAVDIVGTHTAIDGHSLLENGQYNVSCPGTTTPANASTDGLQIKDSQITGSIDDGIHLGGACPNVRLIGDLITGNGTATGPNSRGVYFGGEEMTIANGVIEQSGGIGLDIEGARLVSVGNMYLDNNGKYLGGAGIEVGNSSNISICGNHIHRNGGPFPPPTSQIYFSGGQSNISLCGNIYVPDIDQNDIVLRPSYVYDAASGSTLTNSNFYESPTPQAAGSVFSGGAASLLQPLQVPQYASEMTGYSLSYVSGTVITILQGSAADSTNSAVIAQGACTVNFANLGANGLDITGGIQPSTTYYFYVISGPGGTNPSCIASASLAPSFVNTGYFIESSGSTYAPYGSSSYYPQIYNISRITGVTPYGSPIAGVIADNTVTSSVLSSGTQVSSTGTNTIYTTGSVSGTTVTVPSTANMGAGMLISDNANPTSLSCTAANQIPSGATISTVASGTTLTISAGATASGDCITVSPGIVANLSLPPTGAGTYNFNFYTGIYRMVGALFTNASSQIVPFTQNGSTFYLANPAADINTSSLGTSATLFPLYSVPGGIVVEGFGRCVGGNPTSSSPNDVLLYSPSMTSVTLPPANFPAVPGYSVRSTASLQSFPFSLYTDSARDIVAAAATSLATLQCMTDGWKWNPAQP